MAELFGIFAEFERKAGWANAEPLLFQAETEEEACRGASLLADFIYHELRRRARVLVLGPDRKQIIGDFRRPVDIDASGFMEASAPSTRSR